jgi:hypothetical protein
VLYLFDVLGPMGDTIRCSNGSRAASNASVQVSKVKA